MVDTTTFTEMQQVLDNLNTAQSDASSLAGGFWTTVSAEVLGARASQDANESLLLQTQIAIGNLAGPEWLAVATEQHSPDVWFEHAKEVYNTIRSVNQDLPNWQFGHVLGDTAIATGSDVANVALIGGIGVTTLAVLAGIVYLVFMFSAVRR